MIPAGVLVHACSQCGAEAPERLPGVLPLGWEHYSPLEPSSPLWCSGCVGALLASLVDEMQLFFAGASTRPARQPIPVKRAPARSTRG